MILVFTGKSNAAEPAFGTLRSCTDASAAQGFMIINKTSSTPHSAFFECHHRAHWLKSHCSLNQCHAFFLKKNQLALVPKKQKTTLLYGHAIGLHAVPCGLLRVLGTALERWPSAGVAHWRSKGSTAAKPCRCSLRTGSTSATLQTQPLLKRICTHVKIFALCVGTRAMSRSNTLPVS